MLRTALVHRQRQTKIFSLSDMHTGEKLAYYCKNVLNYSSWLNFFLLCFELSKVFKIFYSSVSKGKTWWILYKWLILEHRFSRFFSLFLWGKKHMVWCRIHSAAVTATAQPNPFMELYFYFTNSLTWSWLQSWGTDGYRNKWGWQSVSVPVPSFCTLQIQAAAAPDVAAVTCLQPQTFALNRVHYCL